MKKELIQSIKIITLSLVIGLGVSIVYATDWTAPLSSAPTCTSGNPGCDVPVNVGPGYQHKTGDLDVADSSIFDNGFISDGQTLITGAPGITSGLHIGKMTTSPDTDLYIYKFSSTGSEHATTYPAQLCVESDGRVSICDSGAPVVNFTFSDGSTTKSFNNPDNDVTPNSNGVTLTWSLSNTTGSTTCTASSKLSYAGTDVSTSVSWTGSKSIAGGTSSGVTVKNFGTTEYKLVCDNDGNNLTTADQTTKTVTASIAGALNYVRSTSTATGTLASSDFTNIQTFYISSIIGAGGAGAGNLVPGTNGVASKFSTITANGGSGGKDFNTGGGGGSGGTVTGITGDTGTSGNAYNTASSQGCGGVTSNSGNYNLTPPNNTFCSSKTTSDGYGGDGDYVHGGGGGGAGGRVHNIYFTNPGTTFTYQVGAGGASTGTTNSKAGNGTLVVSW